MAEDIQNLDIYSQALPYSLEAEQSVLGALLLDSGSPGVYDAAISQYKAICSYLKWEDKGIVTIPGMKQKGDMAQSTDLEKVCQLARSL